MSNSLAQQNALIANHLIFACISDEAAANYIVAKISPDDFIHAEHQAMMENIRAMVIASEAITADRVVAGVQGGIERFNHIIDTTWSSANYEHYVTALLDMSCRRRIGQMLTEIGSLSTSDEVSTTDVLTAIETKLAAIKTPITADNSPKDTSEIIRDWLELMQERMTAGKMKGIPTGYDELDNVISGLQGRLSGF